MSESWKPHDYQKRGIRFLIENACAGLFWDPGMGKTTTMLAAFKLLRSKGWAKRMLVITPLRPAWSVWPGEARKWTEFNGLSVRVLHGVDKSWANVFNSDINVINPEGLPWLLGGINGEWPWDILVVDESTKFKHTNTQRFRVLKPHLEKFKRRYILTGHPAPNGLLDLFGQVFILDLGHALGRFITHYRTTYFNQSGFGGFFWSPKPDAERKIYKRLAPLVLRLEAKDHLELPPLLFNRVEVELPERARKAYREMEALLITELASGKVIAANAAAASGKCRQIANGGLYGADGLERTVHHVHDAKLDATEEIVEELQGTPALIAYEFNHDLERLQKRFPGAPHIGGGVPVKRFREIEAEWNAGKLPVLLVQPQSAAWGLNLQGTRGHIIMHSETWDLDARDQLIERVWRQGQEAGVTVHDIVAKDTVDEVIMMMLKKKDKVQRNLLDALKEYGRDHAK